MCRAMGTPSQDQQVFVESWTQTSSGALVPFVETSTLRSLSSQLEHGFVFSPHGHEGRLQSDGLSLAVRLRGARSRGRAGKGLPIC